MNNQHTKISVGILIYKDNQILFGKTRDKEGNTRYILPVGHLEYMESFSDCANREIEEECGITVSYTHLTLPTNREV